MFTTLTKKRLEKLKEIADNIDHKIALYGNQFGPSDDFVLKLKIDLKRVNSAILELMVMEQETSVKQALID
jgi:hypothetical protein